MPINPSRRDFLAGAARGLLVPFGVQAIGGSVIALAVAAQAEATGTITPYQFGAAGNGRADDTAALQRAVNAAIERGQVLDLDRGTYKVTGSIAGSGDIRIVNSGRATIHAAAGTYSRHGVLVFGGSAARVPGLSASPAKGAATLTTVSAAGLAAGDLGVIYNPSDASYSGFRRYYRAGEFFEVASAAGKALSLRNPLYAGYNRAAVEVYRINPIAGFIRDIIITSDGAPSSLIVIDYARGFEIERPTLRHANNDCIVFSRSIHCAVDSPQISNRGGGRDDYGIVWSNCQHCRVAGGEVYARRHAVAVGGADYVNAVPSRDVITTGTTLRNDPATSTHCADVHGNTERCGYDGCTIFGGFSAQGRASFLRNCTVHAMRIGTAVYAAEVVGGEHLIEGNTFYFGADPSDAVRGAIDFGGNSDALNRNTVDDLTVIVRNNTFVSSAFSARTMLFYARNAGSAAKINVDFTDNDLRVNDFAAAVRVRLASGTAKTDFITVDCNKGALAGRPALYPESGYPDQAARQAGQRRCSV